MATGINSSFLSRSRLNNTTLDGTNNDRMQKLAEKLDVKKEEKKEENKKFSYNNKEIKKDPKNTQEDKNKKKDSNKDMKQVMIKTNSQDMGKPFGVTLKKVPSNI